MKKNFAIIGLAALMVGATVACGSAVQAQEVVQEEQSTTEVDYEALFAYKPYTPQENIVEGNETAVNTISNFVGQEVNVGDEYFVNPCITGTVALGENNENDIYRVYQALDYDADKFSIMFLFDDDTKVVEATTASKSCLNDSFRVCGDYQSEANSQNSCNGAVASLYDGVASIVLNNESGYNLSSIWGYDQTNETVYLIWVNHDCPIWTSHF